MKPMKPRQVSKLSRQIDWETALIQPELKGVHAIYSDGALYTSYGEITMPHIVEAIKASGLADSQLDGVLSVHGFSELELKQLAWTDTINREQLEFHIHDQVGDKPFGERIIKLLGMAAADRLHPSLRVVETLPVINEDSVKQFAESYRLRGYKGALLRHGDAPYLSGKTNKFFLKVA